MIAIFCNFLDLPSGATVWNLVVLPLKCSPVRWKTNPSAHGDGNSDGLFHLGQSGSVHCGGDPEWHPDSRSHIHARGTGKNQDACRDLTGRPSIRIIEAGSFLIVSGTGNVEQERLWNEYVERYHYLGYGVPLGPHIKYFVTIVGEPIACLCFAGAAWRVEARDRWIGWNSEERERNLRYVVNNTRFVVFPWVNVRNLASRLLALAAKRITDDWQRLYAYGPLLLETFVDAERYAGTCYRAANWMLVGYTKGRGKLDRQFKANLSKKAVLLYSLTKDATRRLRA